jgi:hypothetical protein
LGIKGVVQNGIAQLLFSRICTAPAQAVLWKRTARALRDAAAKNSGLSRCRGHCISRCEDAQQLFASSGRAQCSRLGLGALNGDRERLSVQARGGQLVSSILQQKLGQKDAATGLLHARASATSSLPALSGCGILRCVLQSFLPFAKRFGRAPAKDDPQYLCQMALARSP